LTRPSPRTHPDRFGDLLPLASGSGGWLFHALADPIAILVRPFLGGPALACDRVADAADGGAEGKIGQKAKELSPFGPSSVLRRPLIFVSRSRPILVDENWNRSSSTPVD
jgi:hypothetical protein